MDLRERMDSGAMSRYQWFVISMCFLLNLLDGYDVSALAFTATAVSAEFGLSGGELGFLLSAGLVGMGVGSMVLGPVGDLIGRRPMALISVGLAALAMLMTATSGSMAELAVWRFVTGLGVGGILAGGSVIAAEYSSRRWRGLGIAIYTSGFGIGASAGGIFSITLQDQYGWQAVFVLGGLLTGLACLTLAFFLPESVQFLMVRQPRNAVERVNRIAARMGQEPVTTLEAVPTVPGQRRSVRVSELFDAANRRPTLLLWLAFFSLMVAYYFVNSWTPALLETAGMSQEHSATVGIMLALGGTVGALIYGTLTSKWGNRRVLIAFAALSGVTIAAFTLTMSLLSLAFVVGVVIGMLVQGSMAGMYTLAPTTYATRVRSTGVGWAITVGRVGAILAASVTGMLLDGGWTVGQLYLAAGGFMVLLAGAVYLTRAPEGSRPPTRTGKVAVP